MTTKKRTKSSAVKFMESVTGGPLTLGNLLASIRLSDEITQVELAKKLKITKQHLSNIERGLKAVSPERAARFAKALGYPVEQFVSLALQDQITRAGLKLNVRVEVA